MLQMEQLSTLIKAKPSDQPTSDEVRIPELANDATTQPAVSDPLVSEPLRLKEQLSLAQEIMKQAREAVLNPEKIGTAKRRRVPFGFENVTDDEKGPFFNEIIDFLNPFLQGDRPLASISA
eukprot:TRINITY_DN10860_c0_g1_i2.p1 TRINITY_DN10860_c0_g1~~TRINITY_DN10860_c0_g1_i2.p1  ORF type:complete len:121 (-),score=18.45 TRINITY_DN10860_c0_g1_i2:400-762(-)